MLRSTAVGTAGVAAAIAAPYIVPSRVFGAEAPSNRITVGVIGTGNRGFEILKTFLDQEIAQVVAVCDVNRASFGYRDDKQFLGREPGRQLVEDFYAKHTRSGKFEGCGMYTDFRDVLARKDIDAVAVVVPDHWHALMTIAACKAGKDIYCEKPMSLTIAQGRAMVEAVRQHKRMLANRQPRTVQSPHRACDRIGAQRADREAEADHNVRRLQQQNRPRPGLEADARARGIRL